MRTWKGSCKGFSILLASHINLSNWKWLMPISIGVWPWYMIFLSTPSACLWLQLYHSINLFVQCLLHLNQYELIVPLGKLLVTHLAVHTSGAACISPAGGWDSAHQNTAWTHPQWHTKRGYKLLSSTHSSAIVIRALYNGTYDLHSWHLPSQCIYNASHLLETSFDEVIMTGLKLIVLNMTTVMRLFQRHWHQSI